MEKTGPFQIVAICLLPDHLHCIWTLPEGDSDFSARRKVIKARFSHRYLRRGGKPAGTSASKAHKAELGVWQRKFLLTPSTIPLKHGLVQSVKEWKWSSFHRYVCDGYSNPDWGNGESEPNHLNVGE